MKIEMIPNKGPASLGAEIVRAFEWADESDIASAYVTPRALVRIEAALSNAKKDNRLAKIRLLFGLYQRFTPPQSLSEMLRLKRKFAGIFHARVAQNSRFHWKLYIFRKKNLRRIYIGSNNLTKDGLSAEGELSLKLSCRSSDNIAKTLEAEFDKTWREDAVSLSKSVADKYGSLRRPPNTFTRPDKDSALADVLRAAKTADDWSGTKRPSTDHKRRIVLAGTDLKPGTIKIISEETNWDRYGWSYIGDRYKYSFELLTKAKVFVYANWFDPKSRIYWLEWHAVRDTTIIDTPDGKYFVAHSRLPGGWCVKYDKVRKELNEAGITWNRIKSWAAITDSQCNILCRLLHMSPSKLEAVYFHAAHR